MFRVFLVYFLSNSANSSGETSKLFIKIHLHCSKLTNFAYIIRIITFFKISLMHILPKNLINFSIVVPTILPCFLLPLPTFYFYLFTTFCFFAFSRFYNKTSLTFSDVRQYIFIKIYSSAIFRSIIMTCSDSRGMKIHETKMSSAHQHNVVLNFPPFLHSIFNCFSFLRNFHLSPKRKLSYLKLPPKRINVLLWQITFWNFPFRCLLFFYPFSCKFLSGFHLKDFWQWD